MASKGQSLLISGVGDVLPSDIPSWDFLYDVSAVRNPKFRISDRVVTPDGRAFRYGLATEDLANSGRGIFNANVIPGIASTNGYEGSFQVAAAVGDFKVRIGDTTTRVKDAYRGGILVIQYGARIVCYGILGSSTVVSSTYVELTLDASLRTAVTASTNMSAFPSIYSNLVQAAPAGIGVDGFQTCVGILTQPAEDGDYIWIQTWGLHWVTATTWGSTGPGCAANLRDVYVHSDGTIMPAIDSSAVAKQRIGTIAYMGDGTAYGDGVIMLQINP